MFNDPTFYDAVAEKRAETRGGALLVSSLFEEAGDAALDDDWDRAGQLWRSGVAALDDLPVCGDVDDLRDGDQYLLMRGDGFDFYMVCDAVGAAVLRVAAQHE